MEKSSFFNAVLTGDTYDREYFAEDFAAFFKSLITNGIFPNPGTNLQVVSNNDMTITIKAGPAWINGYQYINDSDLILPIEVADGVLKRIDRIVIQFNTIGRAINAVVVKGTFASSPYAPNLFRNADLYELGIADISIINGATSISQANITDLRMNTTYCGWVNSLIQADTTAIFNQYQAWFTAQSNTYNTQMIANQATFQANFEAWFATIQGQLSGDIAGNLAASIATNAAALASHTANLSSQVSGKGASLIGLNDSANQFTATNVEGALNELFTNANSGKQNWVDVVGSPLANTDTFATLKTKTQTLKNTMASNLTIQKQNSVGTESLNDLVNKIGNISSSNIKSMQSGMYSIPDFVNITNITISAVDLTKAIPEITFRNNYHSNPAQCAWKCILTSPTNLQVTCFTNGNSGLGTQLSWCVTEYNNVKSLQSGLTAISTSSQNVSISAINVLKTKIISSFSYASGSASSGNMTLACQVTSSTNINFLCFSSNSTFPVIQWYAIEFN